MATQFRATDRCFRFTHPLVGSLVILFLGMPRFVTADDLPNVAGSSPPVALGFAALQEPTEAKNGQQPGDELKELERVMQQPALVPALEQPVTTVSRQESTVGKSPAAVFVITNDMIRRSGATTIAEALRMVPGLNVARVDNANWAISSRGFNQRFADKLLVQIDGRTVYNPIFSGVYWQLQDTVLQDVERIEVIRGPGATVWGSNAVNGIINVITKSATETGGGLLFGGGGTEERAFSGLRYGAQCGDVSYRVWGKWREVDNGFDSPLNLPGVGSHEDWRAARGGFRIDWNASECDLVTVQGDYFENREGLADRRPSLIAPPFFVDTVEDRYFSGGDVLGRWTHKIDDESDWRIQLYYDNGALRQSSVDLDINTFDLDFQHQFPLTDCQQLIYGIGYRFQDVIFRQSEAEDGLQFRAFPPGRDLPLFSAFVQDEFTLIEDRLFFTAGSKVEDNDFTGFEYQPSGRLLWTPSKREAAWAAVSRAVRIPNFAEQNLRITTPPSSGGALLPRVNPNPGFESEDLLAYELGYRAQPSDAFSFDLALFFNDYNDLRVLVPTGPPVAPFVPLQNQNRMTGETYGAELSANYKMSECWRLYGAYTFLQMQLHADDSLPADVRHGAIGEGQERQSPQNQVYAQSSWDLACDWQLDLIGRYVDSLSGFAVRDADVAVDSYIQMDVRLGWKPRPNVELSVVGQNLLDSNHLEFGSNPLVGRPLVEAQRGVYGMIEWRF
jgi:iron complex outermembrane receptor protein